MCDVKSNFLLNRQNLQLRCVFSFQTGQQPSSQNSWFWHQQRCWGKRLLCGIGKSNKINSALCVFNKRWRGKFFFSIFVLFCFLQIYVPIAKLVFWTESHFHSRQNTFHTHVMTNTVFMWSVAVGDLYQGRAPIQRNFRPDKSWNNKSRTTLVQT